MYGELKADAWLDGISTYATLQQTQQLPSYPLYYFVNSRRHWWWYPEAAHQCHLETVASCLCQCMQTLIIIDDSSRAFRYVPGQGKGTSATPKASKPERAARPRESVLTEMLAHMKPKEKVSVCIVSVCLPLKKTRWMHPWSCVRFPIFRSKYFNLCTPE